MHKDNKGPNHRQLKYTPKTEIDVLTGAMLMAWYVVSYVYVSLSLTSGSMCCVSVWPIGQYRGTPTPGTSRRAASC